MNAATETRPAANCPISGLARVEITTRSTVFVLHTNQVGPNARIECIDGTPLEQAQVAARTLVTGGWTVRLAREIKVSTKIEFACGQDTEGFFDKLAAGDYDDKMMALRIGFDA